MAGLGEIFNSLFQEAKATREEALSAFSGLSARSQGKGGEPEVASFEDVLTRMASQSDPQEQSSGTATGDLLGPLSTFEDALTRLVSQAEGQMPTGGSAPAGNAPVSQTSLLAPQVPAGISASESILSVTEIDIQVTEQVQASGPDVLAQIQKFLDSMTAGLSQLIHLVSQLAQLEPQKAGEALASLTGAASDPAGNQALLDALRGLNAGVPAGQNPLTISPDKQDLLLGQLVQQMLQTQQMLFGNLLDPASTQGPQGAVTASSPSSSPFLASGGSLSSGMALQISFSETDLTAIQQTGAGVSKVFIQAETFQMSAVFVQTASLGQSPVGATPLFQPLSLPGSSLPTADLNNAVAPLAFGDSSTTTSLVGSGDPIDLSRGLGKNFKDLVTLLMQSGVSRAALTSILAQGKDLPLVGQPIGSSSIPLDPHASSLQLTQVFAAELTETVSVADPSPATGDLSTASTISPSFLASSEELDPFAVITASAPQVSIPTSSPSIPTPEPELQAPVIGVNNLLASTGPKPDSLLDLSFHWVNETFVVFQNPIPEPKAVSEAPALSSGALSIPTSNLSVEPILAPQVPTPDQAPSLLSGTSERGIATDPVAQTPLAQVLPTALAGGEVVRSTPLSLAPADKNLPSGFQSPLIPLASDGKPILPQAVAPASQVVNSFSLKIPNDGTPDITPSLLSQSVNLGAVIASDPLTLGKSQDSDKSRAQDAQDGSVKIDVSNVLGRISDQISTHSSELKAVSRLSFQLVPESLGRVTIQIALVDHSVSAKLIVTRPEVKEALQNNLIDLKTALNQAGLQIDQLQVQVQGGGANLLAQYFQYQQEGYGNSLPGRGSSADLDEAKTLEKTGVLGALSVRTSLLDVLA